MTLAPGLAHFLTLGTLLFLIGIMGVILNRKNILIVLMSIELVLLAVNLNFIALSSYFDDVAGYVFVLFVMTVAAAESAIGLAILVVAFRKRKSINVDDWKELSG